MPEEQQKRLQEQYTQCQKNLKTARSRCQRPDNYSDEVLRAEARLDALYDLAFVFGFELCGQG